MQKSKLMIASLILVGLMFTGFSCSSSNLTGARLYIQQKNYDAAYAALQRELSVNPQSDEGWYLLGYVYGEKGNMDSLVTAFNKSLSISQKFIKDITDYRKYYWANEYNKGVGFFQKGNTATTSDSIKLNYSKSIDAFKMATMLEPDSSITYKNLAFVYMNSGKYDEAVEPLKTLIDKNKSRDGYRYLGQIYYDQARKFKNQYAASNDAQDSVKSLEYYNKAIDILEQGRKIYPKDSDFLVILSNSYIGAHKTEVAMEAFKAGIEQDPNNKYYHYNYGVLLLGAKDFQKSIDQFKKALDIDSKYVNAEYNMGVAYLKWGDFLNEQADKKGIKSEDYKDKIQIAIPFLENAVQMDPSQPDMWETLGKAYSIMGKQTEAKNAFDKADQLRK